jgi:hypothetical protein
MFEVSLTVKIDGIEHQITAEPRDLLVWEKTSRGKKLGELLPISEDGEHMDARRLSLVEMYRLAWITARRLELFAGPIEQFEEEVTVVLRGAASPGPTRPAPSAGSASSSRSKPASRQASGRSRTRARS